MDDNSNTLLILAAAFYFAPTLIGWSRGAKSLAAIFVVNLLLGWTLLGWVVALAWSLAGNTGKTIIGSGWNRRVVDEDALRVKVMEETLSRLTVTRQIQPVIEQPRDDPFYWSRLQKFRSRA